MAVQHKVVSPNLFLLHLSTFHTRIRKLNNALIRGFCTVFCWWRSSLPGCKGLLCKQTHVRQSTGLSSLTEIPEWASGLVLHINGSKLIAAEYSQGMNIQVSVNLGLKHKIRSHLFNSYLPNTQTYIDTHRHKRTNNELKRQKKKKKKFQHITLNHTECFTVILVKLPMCLLFKQNWWCEADLC